MKVVAATDGSKYGRWAIEWLGHMPFINPPVVRVLHVVDVAGLRAPFMIQPVMAGTERYLQAEVKRLEKDAKSTKKESTELLASLKLCRILRRASQPRSLQDPSNDLTRYL